MRHPTITFLLLFLLTLPIASRKRIQHLEYIIVGAGPGGLQLGRFLQQTQRNYLILERAPTVGSSFDWYPRHRQLISINNLISLYIITEYSRNISFISIPVESILLYL